MQALTTADKLVRTTASVDLTTPTCRKVLTKLIFFSQRLHHCANEVNRRVVCTLSEVCSRVFSSAQRVLSDFPRGVVATSHTPLGGDFLLTETVLSPTSIFRGAFILECRPNPRYGASSGSRTHTICLEGRSTSRYTIPAFFSLFLRFLHIYYTKIFKKSQIFGGKPKNRTWMSRATTYRFSISLATHWSK